MLTINNTLDGYLKDVEILGNTIQSASNLADIRSVGDKVEGQELYEIPVLTCGKNLFDKNILIDGKNIKDDDGVIHPNSNHTITEKFYLPKNKKFKISGNSLLYTILHFYDKDDVWNGKQLVYSSNNVLDTGLFEYDYLRLEFDGLGYENKDIQLEEGTVATPYEPYQEDKITILSPTPLEKVGDVRDRIICKDGVLGVEKNVETVVFDGSENWTLQVARNNTLSFRLLVSDTYPITVCNQVKHGTNVGSDEELHYYGSEFFGAKSLILNLSKSKVANLQEFKDFISSNNLLIKYATAQPQFIPLPHDQQVKLRTFANKTNISFLTEIEGTIKAQVPKSLGATVNTHTEQINNLNKELDRVKKLEESTVSTVETESDFTTVEATSNGYFEDVKLEGKTMTPFIASHDIIKDEEYIVNSRYKTYTIFSLECDDKDIVYFAIDFTKISQSINIAADFLVTHRNSGGYAARIIGADEFNALPNGRYKKGCTRTISIEQGTYCSLKIGNCGDMPSGAEANTELFRFKIHDFTCYNLTKLFGKGNEPSVEWCDANLPMIQEITSVGDGADEIVVSSVNASGNLFDRDTCKYNTTILASGEEASNSSYVISDFIKVNGNTSYYVEGLPVVVAYDSNKNFIKYIRNASISDTFTTDFNCSYVKIRNWNSLGSIELQKETVNSAYLIKGTTPKQYTPHQSDKKRLLYYNNETQTWEKPILREWDSIEKHSDGKYYYHQRSGEVVLNGSESWVKPSAQPTSGTHTRFIITNFPPNVIQAPTSVLCDKYNNQKVFNESSVGIYVDKNLNITVDGIIELETFKSNLQANNVAVVYQLAQEKVYECTNIDLITYANETNYVVESGAIVPRTTLKVHNNISNVVSLLQKKVSLLESNITKYMITQNRMQLASTYSADSVTFKVDYALCSEEVEYNEDLYNLILNNILVGKDNYDYDKMFTMILDYASWNQISWEQFDILVGLMDMQHNPPVEDEIVEEIPNEIM